MTPLIKINLKNSFKASYKISFGEKQKNACHLKKFSTN